MKVAIISDTHDNLANLKIFFDYCQKEKIKTLIHCGDVTKGETLKEIENYFEEIFLSLGNCDNRESIIKEKQKSKIFEEMGKIEINGLKVGLTHQLAAVEKKINFSEFDFFFFGHTHYPDLKEKTEYQIANPGNLAGLYFKATFAILDTTTKKLELKILEKIK